MFHQLKPDISAWLAGLVLMLVACTNSNITHKSVVTSKAKSVSVQILVDPVKWPASFGFGQLAKPQEIAVLDIDVRPDGQGLPPGLGTVVAGKTIYASKCAACHGKTGIEGPNNRLVEPVLENKASGTGTGKEKTIGNYWPYATTLFDYIRRAMPFNAPGSLTNEEVYALTAFLLHANKIISAETIINAQTLPNIIMPAQKHFVIDDRRGGPEVR